MKTIPVEEAIGMVLGHDVTRIAPGESKGPAFRKGHVVREEDIPVFLDIGKRHLYVLELDEGTVHENEAALRITQGASGRGITLTEPKEGRVNLMADYQGLLKVNPEALSRINSIEAIAFASLKTDGIIFPGQAVAGARIIPLVCEEEKIRQVERICRNHAPVIQVKPFIPKKVGIVTTGSEVYSGRIQDKFGPVLRDKFGSLSCPVMGQTLVSDDIEMTVGAIRDYLHQGAELIAVTGGMSVDPDDQTPAAIRAAGGQVVTYGAPVFPGAMFMLAFIGDVPVVGLPGCVMYFRASIFELAVHRILAGETVTKADIVEMGHGGFCSGCLECRYPICGFGK